MRARVASIRAGWRCKGSRTKSSPGRARLRWRCARYKPVIRPVGYPDCRGLLRICHRSQRRWYGFLLRHLPCSWLWPQDILYRLGRQFRLGLRDEEQLHPVLRWRRRNRYPCLTLRCQQIANKERIDRQRHPPGCNPCLVHSVCPAEYHQDAFYHSLAARFDIHPAAANLARLQPYPYPHVQARPTL